MGDPEANIGDHVLFIQHAQPECGGGGDKMNLNEKFTPSVVEVYKGPLREFIGTYIFLCFAYGVSSCNGSSVLNVAIAYGLGLAVAAFLFGCDANPAVSLTKLLLRRGKNPLLFVMLIIAQFLAAILAAVTINYGFECDISYAVAELDSSIGYAQGLVIEMILATFLIIAACMSFAKESLKASISGIIAGLTLLAGILVAGGLTGCSINPFRALGASIFSHFPDDAWIYYVAPFIASILAALVLVLTKPAPRQRCPKRC